MLVDQLLICLQLLWLKELQLPIFEPNMKKIGQNGRLKEDGSSHMKMIDANGTYNPLVMTYQALPGAPRPNDYGM